MRILYRLQGDANPNTKYYLAVADFVRERFMLTQPFAMFCFEDFGSRWGTWGTTDLLRDGGSFEQLLGHHEVNKARKAKKVKSRLTSLLARCRSLF